MLNFISNDILVLILWLGLILVLLYSPYVEEDGFRWIFLGIKGFLETCIITAGVIGIKLTKTKEEKRMHCLWKALLAMVNSKNY